MLRSYAHCGVVHKLLYCRQYRHLCVFRSFYNYLVDNPYIKGYNERTIIIIVIDKAGENIYGSTKTQFKTTTIDF